MPYVDLKEIERLPRPYEICQQVPLWLFSQFLEVEIIAADDYLVWWVTKKAGRNIWLIGKT